MKTNRFFLAIALAFAPVVVFGQNMYDALRFSQLQYEGTARSMAMGNAFTALGGDLGGISVNPASSGVFRYSEFAITPSLTNTISNTVYNNNRSHEIRTNFGLSNVGWLGNFKTGRKSGLLNINVAIVANQTNNFTSRSSAMGREAHTSWASSIAANMPTNIHGSALSMPEGNENSPFYNSGAPWKAVMAWNTFVIDTLKNGYNYIAATENVNAEGKYYVGGPLNQRYYRQASGYTQDVTVNVGGNVSDKLFFGLNLTLQSIWYSHSENYSEEALSSTDFGTGFSKLNYYYNQTTSGIGFKLSAGVIYLPVAGLRIGASVSTPTWLSMNDQMYEGLSSNVFQKDYSVDSPINIYRYKLNTPFRWNVGAAYTFAGKALISVDYENTNYRSSKFVVNNGMSQDDIDYFNDQNKKISSQFRSVNNIRVGAEVKILPILSLRAGYNFYDSPEKGYHSQIQYATAGIGYSSKKGFFADIAYQQQCNRSQSLYTLYEEYPIDVGLPLANEKSLNWKMLLTLGFRF